MSGGHSSRRMGFSMLVNIAGILCSRVFGLVRDMVMTWYWGGSGAAQAAFHLAFSIPNMFRMLFGEGAFTAAFVPILAGKLEKGTKEEAWRFSERVITLQLLALAAVSLITGIISVVIYFLLHDGTREHVSLTFKILPLLMPYSLLICVAGSFGSILNSLRKFGLPALNPVIFNIVQIAGVAAISFLWKNDNPMALYCFCGSILLAGILQMLTLMYACRRQGFIFHFAIDWKNEDVKNVCKKFLPGLIGAGASQINQLLDKIMVGFLGTLAVSSINYSHHLVYLPVGLFGVAMGTVCLTDLSRAAGKDDAEAFSKALTYSLRMVLFLSLPCTVLLFVFAEPVIRLLYFRGAFDEASVNACTYAMKCYIPGIPAFCLLKVATTPHHGKGDTTTPVRVAIACIALNFILNISLIWTFKQGGLALSTSICTWVNVACLLALAKKHASTWSPWPSLWSGCAWLAAALLSGALAHCICKTANLNAHLSGFRLYAAEIILGGGSGTAIYLLLGGSLFILLKRFSSKHKV